MRIILSQQVMHNSLNTCPLGKEAEDEEEEDVRSHASCKAGSNAKLLGQINKGITQELLLWQLR